MNISSPEEKIIIMKDAPALYYNDDGVLIMSKQLERTKKSLEARCCFSD